MGDRRHGWWRTAAVAAVLAVLVALALGRSLGGEFVWDDRPLIVENRLIQQPAELWRVFANSFWETGDRHDRFRAFFRPLVTLTYGLDRAAWGLDPRGFHLTNLLLHLACCGLVVALARQEGLGRAAAVGGGALFAVHPVHVESVAWIAGRTDVLATLLVLVSLLAFRRVADGAAGRPMLALSLGSFALALLSKEVAAVLPALVAADRWCRPPPGERPWRRRAAGVALAAGPFVAVLAVSFVVRARVLDPAMPLYTLEPLSWMATALFALARSTTLMLLPLGLDAHHPHPPLDSLAGPVAAQSLAMMAVVAAAGVWLWRRGPAAAFWLAWTYAMLLPVLAFGRFGDVIVADRFLYAPSVGLALLAAHGLQGLARHASRPALRSAVAVAALLLAGLTWGSHRRTAVWRDDVTLFADMARTSPDAALVQSNLGMALYREGRLDEALDSYRLALALEPDHAMTHNNLAAAYERSGRYRAALRHYRLALAAAPRMVEAAVNEAHLLVRTGRAEEGMRRLRAVLEVRPRHGGALFAYAEALDRTGRSDEAAAWAERAVRAAPELAPAQFLAGQLRADRGDEAGAARAMRRFLALWPADDEWAAKARRVVAGAER